MRFADRSVYATRTAFDRFHLELDTPEERAAALERQHFMTSAVVSIATQPDLDIALLDMIVLVTLERLGAERVWLPTVFGEAGRPYLEALVTLEESIWALGQRVMTPPQLQELRAIVADWENSPPDFFRRASFFRQSRVSAGRVRAAAATQAFVHLFAPLFEAFMREQPRIDVSFRTTASTDQTVSEILNGAADVGFASLPVFSPATISSASPT